MIDQTRAIIAAAVVGVVALLALTVGFIGGRATAGDDDGGNERDESGAEIPEGDGLPAGPSRVEDGIPMGFAQTEDGALAAAVTWMTLLASAPPNERPDDVQRVLSEDYDGLYPLEGGSTLRGSYIPNGARMTMSGTDAAVVDILGTVWGGPGPGEDVAVSLLEISVSLVWDAQAGDWQIDEIDDSQEELTPPLTAAQVQGYREVRPSGGELGGVFVEEVPGE